MNHDYFKLHISVLSKLHVCMVLSWIILLFGCQNTGEKEIVIISTNDIHGSIEQFPKLGHFRGTNKGKTSKRDSSGCRGSIHGEPVRGPCKRKGTTCYLINEST